jgi:hypothetical protein
MQRLEPIRKSLTAYWPTLYPSNTLESFWEHEFEKHGTCAASDPTLSTGTGPFQATRSRSAHSCVGRHCSHSTTTITTTLAELAYFNATLTARATFDISVAFSKAGIQPSSNKAYSVPTTTRTARHTTHAHRTTRAEC